MSILLNYTVILIKNSYWQWIKPNRQIVSFRSCWSDKWGLVWHVIVCQTNNASCSWNRVCLLSCNKDGLAIFTYIYTVHSTIRTSHRKQLLNSKNKFKCRTVINVCDCFGQSTIYCIHAEDRCQRDWSLWSMDHLERLTPKRL